MVETSKDTHNSPAEIQGSSQPMPSAEQGSALPPSTQAVCPGPR